MNTTDDNEQNPRPLGYWLKAVDSLMAAEFATAFESFGLTRRDWRIVNRIDGTVDGDRRLQAHKLRRLLERGWVTDAEGIWALTDEGRDAKERLGAIVDGIRAKVTDAVPTEDLATTVTTLEQIARAFDWDENTPLPRGRGRDRGHRRGHRRGRDGFGSEFGPGFDPRGFRRGFDHEFDPRFGPRDAEHAHLERGLDGHGDRRHGEHAFAHDAEVGAARASHGSSTAPTSAASMPDSPAVATTAETQHPARGATWSLCGLTASASLSRCINLRC